MNGSTAKGKGSHAGFAGSKSDVNPQDKSAPFTGEVAPFAELSGKERLISELIGPRNLARNTEIPNVYNQAALEMLTYLYSDESRRKELLEHWGVPAMLPQETGDIGSLMLAFVIAYKNAAISHERMSRAEYITGLQGVQEQEDERSRRQRILDTIGGV